MNLHHLRVFLKVAELEHITRASEELILSQPAVSKTIQNLEQETGLRLIERQGRRIVLTQAGEVLHTHARRIFALEREMEEELAMLKSLEIGEITFGVSTTNGVYVLPLVVAQYRKFFPKVELSISFLNSHEIIEQVLNWRLDFGLVEGDASMVPSELQVDVFARDELLLVVHPKHRWTSEHSLRPENLGSGELLLREEGSGSRELLAQAFLDHQMELRPLLTLSHNEAIKQMVMGGVGAAILPAITVRRELASGDLVQVSVDGLDLHRQLSLIQRPGKQLSRAAQSFCALLRPVIDGQQDIQQIVTP